MTALVPLAVSSQAELDALPRGEDGRLDLTPFDVSGCDFGGMELCRVTFSRHTSERCRRLSHVHFKDSRLIDCEFAGAEVADVSFRGARMIGCDLRYAKFRDTTLAHARLRLCDLYRAVFEGNNVFERAELEACSLHRANLAGSDLGRDNLGPAAIVQASDLGFRSFLERFATVPAEAIPNYVAVRDAEAAGIYRALSSLWSTRGFFGDATWAYIRARRFERRSRSPAVVWRAAAGEAALRRRTPPGVGARVRAVLAALPGYLELLLSGAVCSYGTSVRRVLGTMAIVILAFAATYEGLGSLAVDVEGGPRRPAASLECLTFSIGRMLAGAPEGVHVRPRHEVLAQLQTFLGLGLVGLFGFVLGNRFRQS